VLPLEDVTVAEGSEAVLTCCVCGRPTPTFEWSRAGRRIDVGRVAYDQLTGNLRLEVSQSSNMCCFKTYGKVLRIGTLCYNWPMSAHASQAFSIAHCTDSEDLPTSVVEIIFVYLFASSFIAISLFLRHVTIAAIITATIALRKIFEKRFMDIFSKNP